MNATAWLWIVVTAGWLLLASWAAIQLTRTGRDEPSRRDDEQ